MMHWASGKTRDEAVPCGGQGRGLRESMRSLQVAACVGGKALGAAEKSDKAARSSREPPGRLPEHGGGSRSRAARGLPAQNVRDTHGGAGPGGAAGAGAAPPAGGSGSGAAGAGLRTAGTRRALAEPRPSAAPGGCGASPVPAGGSAAPVPPQRCRRARGCGRPAWEGLSGGPSPGADGAAAAAIRRRGSRCPAWEGPCCIAAAALLPLRAHNGDSQLQQRLRRRERAGPGRPAGARRRQQHAG